MRVLVVDDDKNNRESLRKYLEGEGIACATAENGASALRILETQVFQAAIVDLRMPGVDGMEVLRRLNDLGSRLPVIIVSAFGDIDDAVGAMKLGARDYLVKPYDPDELTLRVRRAVEDQNLRDTVEAGRERTREEFVGCSEAVERIRSMVAKIAASHSTVLITGESGTGKEVVARMIHALSERSSGPFVAINVGGLPETLLESELFGYEKGAFTGAEKRKNGTLEVASSGTLFLDEIGEMPGSLQVKLLRVLQEKTITRLGSTHPVPVDARIISATNRDLEARVAEGEFREDLFYRLNVVRIRIPPLRERPEDIPLLVGRLVDTLNRRMARSITGVDGEALRRLMEYPFPGNVRELENVMERAFIFAEGDAIGISDLELPGDRGHRPVRMRTLRDAERSAIRDALLRWEGNRTRAAEELGVSRRTLINKIREYSLDL